jgi:transcription antitermination protein NusB
MATPRDIRRLALLALYQLDARGDGDLDAIRAALEDAPGLEDSDASFDEPNAAFKNRDYEKAIEFAQAAFAMRDDADAMLLELAPEWPAHRQAAIDRAILRLGFYELISGHAPPRAAINEAVELARAFSTDKSPSFVNGLLSAIHKRVAASQVKPDETGDTEYKEESW